MKSIFKNSIIVAALLFGAASVSNAQVKVGANPAAIGANSNLEVEAANGNKTIVNKATGQVTIQDGTQGVDKVLTSDASGNANWKSFTEANVPTMLFVGTIDNTVDVGTSTSGDVVVSRFPFTAAPGHSAGWNATTRAYTVPVSGFYRVEMSARFGSSSSGSGYVILSLRGKLGISTQDNFFVGNVGGKSLIETAYYNAGDQIFAHVWQTNTGVANIYQASFNVTYIP